MTDARRRRLLALASASIGALTLALGVARTVGWIVTHAVPHGILAVDEMGLAVGIPVSILGAAILVTSIIVARRNRRRGLPEG